MKLLVFVLGLVAGCAHAQQGSDAFRLHDSIGRTWQNEVVRFEATPSATRSAKAGQALVGHDGRAVAYQLVEGRGAPVIAFATDLPPFETREYRFTAQRATAVTDLRVEEDADSIRITNKSIGISVSKKLAGGAGPIKSIRLTSGRWVGKSLLKTARPLSGYTAEVISRGPVTAEILCRLFVGGQPRWELRFRVNANEPVVLIDETFSLGNGASLELDLADGFHPDGLLYRYGRSTAEDANSVGQVATWKIQADAQPAFVLEPWLHWWEKQRQGTWFGLYNEKQPDLLAIGAREPSVWVDPAKPAATRSFAQLPLTLARDSLTLSLPLNEGTRKWMISAHDKDAALDPLRRGNTRYAPAPQQYLIKHGDFPLDRIKDYALEWNEPDIARPRLLIQAKDIPGLRSRIRIDRARLEQLAKVQLTQYDIEDAITYFVATGDASIGRQLASTTVRWVQEAVDMLVRQDQLPTMGFAPHHQIKILFAVNAADAIWSSGHLSAEARVRIRAQFAFLGYTVNRDDYWSPSRGFSANPNMTTTVAAFQTALACMIREHPLAPAWVANGMRELKDNQLDRWSDDNGGWLEAPHYAIVSYDYLLGAFLMTYNAGFNQYLFDPRMKRVIEWLAKISTPPDAAGAGLRYLPPIGNSMMREPSGEFGVMASLWKERDPVFASEMQWMYRQHGSLGAPGVSGFFPMLAGYRGFLVDPGIHDKAPAYRSELFPRTGVVLRDGFPSDRETQLHLIAGTNHAHYDRDSGSITLWGRGRVVANDFGYYGEAPGDDHSMVVSAAAPDASLMQVMSFIPGEQIDYVRGVKNNAWERAIVFMKQTGSDPSYFIVSDSLSGMATGTWRLWLSALDVKTDRQVVLVRGHDDVDTDIFFARPAQVALATEARTRNTQGMAARKYDHISTTQTGVVTQIGAGAGVTTVIYPRLRTEKPPRFESLAEGKGVKVQTPGGIDYVFSSATRFVYKADGIQFEGTVGAVRMRAGGPVLWLGDAGTVSAAGKTLKREKDAAQASR